MKAEYDDEDDGTRTIGEGALMDVKEMSVYSHADTVVMVFETADEVEHCAEFELDDATRLIDSIKTAIRYAEDFVATMNGVN